MNSLPVRLFHAVVSGILLGTMLSLGAFLIHQKLYAATSLANFRGNGWSTYVPQSAANTVNGNNPTADDEDGDGIPNAWETANSHNPNAADDAAYDFDFDGLTEKQEYDLSVRTNGSYGKPLGNYQHTEIVLPQDYAIASNGAPKISAINLVETAKNGFSVMKIVGYRIGASISSTSVYTYDPLTARWARVLPPSTLPVSVELRPTDINSKGQVVGNIYYAGTYKGFIWTPDPDLPAGGESIEFSLNPTSASPTPAIPKRISDTGYLLYSLSSPGGTLKAADPNCRPITPLKNPWTTPQYIDVNDYGEFVGTIANPMTWQLNTFLAIPDGPYTLSAMSLEDLNRTGAGFPWGDLSGIEWINMDCYSSIDGTWIFPGDVCLYQYGEVVDAEGNLIDPATFPEHQYGTWGGSTPYFRRYWGSDEIWWSWDQTAWEFASSSENPPSWLNDWGEFAGLYSVIHIYDWSGGFNSDDSYGAFFFDGSYHLMNEGSSIHGISNDPQILFCNYSDYYNQFCLWSDNVVCPVVQLLPADAAQPVNVKLCDNGVMILQENSRTLQILIPCDDADGDGMPDDWEVFYGFNPNLKDSNADADGDGTNNLGEFLLRSDPNAAPIQNPNGDPIDTRDGIDTDRDLIPNSWECLNGMNYDHAPDAREDFDRDGYTNLQEYRLNTDPRGAPSYEIREVGPLAGATGCSLASAVLGVDQAGGDHLFFHATPALNNGRSRPASWSPPHGQLGSQFSFYASSTAIATVSTSLIGIAPSGAALATVSTNPRKFFYWPMPDSTSPVELYGGASSPGGGVVAHNIESLSSASFSPSGNFLVARRTLASATGTMEWIRWDFQNPPVPLPMPADGVTLGSTANLRVNDYGHVAGTGTLAGKNVALFWKFGALSASTAGVVLPLHPGGTISSIIGLSNGPSPVVAGNANVLVSNTLHNHATVWHLDTSASGLLATRVDLGTLASGNTSSLHSISPAGLVAGTANTLVNNSLKIQAFIATPSGIPATASSSWTVVPQGDPGVNVSILSTNDSGEILGVHYEFTPEGTKSVPTLWRHGRAHPLDSSLPPSSGYTLANITAINPNGTLLATAWKDGTSTTILLTPDRDTDGDGMPDAFENRYSFNAYVKNSPTQDSDSDDLSDLDEYRYGTEPRDSDSDNDGIKDGWEVSWGLLPLDSTDAALDPDGDRVTNLRESQINTTPTGIYKVETRLTDTDWIYPSVMAVSDSGQIIHTGNSIYDYGNLPDGMQYYTSGQQFSALPASPADGTTHLILPSYYYTQSYNNDWSQYSYSGDSPAYYPDSASGTINGFIHRYSSICDGSSYNGFETAFLLPDAANRPAEQDWIPWETIQANLCGTTGGDGLPVLSSDESVYIFPEVVSTGGNQRIHRTSYSRALMLDAAGNFISELPAELNWQAVNNLGHAAAAASSYVSGTEEQPGYTIPEVRIHANGTTSTLPLPYTPGLDSYATVIAFSDDGKILLFLQSPAPNGSWRVKYGLLDSASGTISTVRQPNLGNETVNLLSNKNARLLGNGPRPFQITPDGTCIRLEALRVKNTPADTPVPLGILYPRTLTPNHIASEGRVTLTTTNDNAQTVILQIVPHNDTDGDGVPDDWETANGVTGGTGDQDGDGLDDAGEFAHGSDPMNTDSDQDGMTDGLELAAGFDITNRDENHNGLTDGYEDFDDDKYINREEALCRTDANNGLKMPDGKDPTNPVFLVRDYNLVFDQVRSASFNKPGFKGFIPGILSAAPEVAHDGTQNPSFQSFKEAERKIQAYPEYYLKATTTNIATSEFYQPTMADGQLFDFIDGISDGNMTTEELYFKIDGAYTSTPNRSGNLSSFSLRIGEDESYDFDPETPEPEPSDEFIENLFRYGTPDFRIISSTETLATRSKHINSSRSWQDEGYRDLDGDGVYTDWGVIDYTETLSSTYDSTESVALDVKYDDSSLIEDLKSAMPLGYRDLNGTESFESHFLWGDDHRSASMQDGQYALSVANLPPGVLPGAKVVFHWKEVFKAQEGDLTKTTWKSEDGTLQSPGHYATATQYLEHPVDPGVISLEVDGTSIGGPAVLAAINPGESTYLEYEETDDSAQKLPSRTIHRGKSIRFHADLTDQKLEPTLTATGTGTVTLWELKSDGQWLLHPLPFRLPAEQAAGASSDPGRYMLQGTGAGLVTLAIKVGDETRGSPFDLNVVRVDLDVDSNNTGSVNSTGEEEDEEKIESNLSKPGKLLLGKRCAESSEEGIPLHPDELACLKIQTANLQPGEDLSFTFPVEFLRIWNCPPGQTPSADQEIKSGQPFTLGSNTELSIQSLSTTIGLVCIGVTSGDVSDEVLVNIIPVEIGVDADRDGEITFDTKDETTAEKPFRFWINNDQDNVETDEPIIVGIPDSQSQFIQTLRDLEDFTRVTVATGIPLWMLKNGQVQLGLKFQVRSGNPSVNIFQNQSATGDASYLSDAASAYKQVGAAAYQEFPKDSSGITKIPHWYWNDRSDSTAHLIFEGVTKGEGELIVTIHKNDNTMLGEVGGVHIKLLDVREMYQRARIDNEPGEIPDPWVNNNPPEQTWVSDDWDWPYSEDPGAEPITAIFVHGWRLKYMDFMNWSDTSYKRLWHQGFKGKFYAFRWPTFSGDNNGLPYGLDEQLESHTDLKPGGLTYNASEYRAWLCGSALASFVNQLPNAGRRALFAHSMGNVIVGAALREGMSIQRYALCNTAMGAMAYDPDYALRNQPGTSTLLDHIFPLDPLIVGDTPDTDSDAAICESFGVQDKFAKNQFPATNNPYEANASPAMTNFGLPDDEALGTWTANNEFFKPDWDISSGYGYDRSGLAFGHKLYRITNASGQMLVRQITNPHEAMGYVTKSLTRTLGAELRTGGSISGFVDMRAWAPDTNHAGFGTTHSAQWRWNNQSTNLFWKKLAEQLRLKTNETENP